MKEDGWHMPPSCLCTVVMPGFGLATETCCRRHPRSARANVASMGCGLWFGLLSRKRAERNVWVARLNVLVQTVVVCVCVCVGGGSSYEGV